MDIIIEFLLPIIVTLIASSSFWVWIAKRDDKKSLQTTLLIGLAHDRLLTLGTHYINRGWVSHGEYENLNDYLYKPYAELGGNGTVKRMMLEVDKLPMRSSKPITELQGEKE